MNFKDLYLIYGVSLLKYIPAYSIIIAEIKANGLWSNRLNQLPTFEYYMENCIINKDGPYDFTAQRYKHIEREYELIPFSVNEIRNRNSVASKVVKQSLSYSYYMGTPFNFTENIEITDK